MRIAFHKMNGLGNDFVIVDERVSSAGLSVSRITALADRRRGIGCDQLVVLGAPSGPDHHVHVRFFNPDGSEAGACGNASRCVAWLIACETGLREVVLRTRAGLLAAVVESRDSVTVDMGVPDLSWHGVPLSREADTLCLPLPGGPAALSMGNPHATFFVDDLSEDLPDAASGAALESDPLFPERANIGFARILAPDLMRLRVWERGAGFTLACGSGACAAVVNAARRGLGTRRMRVVADGGEMVIDWGEDGRVRMTGPVALSFTGEAESADYPQ
ncbi:diaminopimelate epimerase [Acetobacter sp. AN02]|uniref:diaminopimelate epimerase n=1 Tax=Acetobacter sp. AN02 TaxID=2894186 RepID=UPI0024342843|nr:diaminopimelate epimerase [Acetobacter sp. AN02]MDG6093994.1 diaminopimelate epimerase [Acetobacter sp. AN02]